jgi:hypothetical protein
MSTDSISVEIFAMLLPNDYFGSRETTSLPHDSKTGNAVVLSQKVEPIAVTRVGSQID